MDALETRGDFTVLTEEPNIFRANWIAGAVEAAGIPTHVEQDDLADEFSVAQKAIGQPRVRVLVPSDRLVEANDVFLDMSQPIPVIEEGDEEDDAALDAMENDRRSRMSTAIIVVVALIFLGPLAFMFGEDLIRSLFG